MSTELTTIAARINEQHRVNEAKAGELADGILSVGRMLLEAMGAPALSPSRRCGFCGQPLEGKRRDALFCGASCRREYHRVARLLSGRSDPPYRNLAEYDGRARKRASSA